MKETSPTSHAREPDGTAQALSLVSILSTGVFLLPLLFVAMAMLMRAHEGGEQSMLMGLVFIVTAPVTTVCAIVVFVRLGVRYARLARWSLGLYWLSMPAVWLLVQLLAFFGIGGAK